MAKRASNSNGRITVAVLGEKIDTLQRTLEGYCKMQATDHDRLAVAEGDIKRVSDRVSAWAGVQAAVSAALAAALGYIGSRH